MGWRMSNLSSAHSGVAPSFTYVKLPDKCIRKSWGWCLEQDLYRWLTNYVGYGTQSLQLDDEVDDVFVWRVIFHSHVSRIGFRDASEAVRFKLTWV